MATSTIKDSLSRAKNVTVTETTNANGAINLTSALGGVYIHTRPILAVYVLDPNANKYAELTATNGNNAYATIKNVSTNAILSNTSVTLRVVYLD